MSQKWNEFDKNLITRASMRNQFDMKIRRVFSSFYFVSIYYV